MKLSGTSYYQTQDGDVQVKAEVIGLIVKAISEVASRTTFMNHQQVCVNFCMEINLLPLYAVHVKCEVFFIVWKDFEL